MNYSKLFAVIFCCVLSCAVLLPAARADPHQGLNTMPCALLGING